MGRVGERLGRLPLWPALAAVGAVVLAVQLPGDHATAWHHFETAVELLAGDRPGEGGGLALYRDHPELQFGPLSVVAAAPLVALGGGSGELAAMVALSGLGLVAFAQLLAAVDRLAPGWRRGAPPAVLLVAGATFVVAWGDVAVRTAHLDDALALLALAVGVRWCAEGRGGPAVAALAVAAAAKPWAIVAAPLAAVPGRPGPAALGRVALVGAAALATWAPFVLAEPATLDTSRFAIENDPTSVLRALGVHDPVTPRWARPAQLVGGVALAGAVVRWRWWPAALLAGLGWRLLLEPGAHRYYTAGIVLGGLLVELVARRDRLPMATVAAAVALEVTALPGAPVGPGRWLRLATVASVLAAALAVGRGGPAAPGPGSGEGADEDQDQASDGGDGGGHAELPGARR